ncbi:hypothetical protein SKAU_G00002140 [Synaphobranchus kaupii]|uniref:Uncharacterized protein n=1 Tax=Synaphobranchus kaupii TaxID=118154 RepID=A0A9Q1JAD5_SYNKA|nr:hypothetical protein SKAU_G00002140 [Synaphobranchus kaupii]
MRRTKTRRGSQKGSDSNGTRKVEENGIPFPSGVSFGTRAANARISEPSVARAPDDLGANPARLRTPSNQRAPSCSSASRFHRRTRGCERVTERVSQFNSRWRYRRVTSLFPPTRPQQGEQTV